VGKRREETFPRWKFRHDTRDSKKPEVVLHLDRRIPGEVASDICTRKAQAFKTENSEVIFTAAYSTVAA
jgi:hypothetical protein